MFATHGTEDCNWRTNDDGGGSAAVRNWPGKDRGEPYTSSAADTPESSRGAARSPSNTQGR
jgi:hypothetical protein